MLQVSPAGDIPGDHLMPFVLEKRLDNKDKAPQHFGCAPLSFRYNTVTDRIYTMLRLG
jgi:hypothetical protein